MRDECAHEIYDTLQRMWKRTYPAKVDVERREGSVWCLFVQLQTIPAMCDAAILEQIVCDRFFQCVENYAASRHGESPYSHTGLFVCKLC